MKEELKQKINQAKTNRKEVNKFMKRLKQRPPKNLDTQFQELHEQAFERIDCLDCANCCKTTSPIFYDKDVERMAAHFRMKATDFFKQYLRVEMTYSKESLFDWMECY